MNPSGDNPPGPADPCWIWAHHSPPGNQPLPYWLLDETSLTDRLVTISGGEFSVARLHQTWQLPRPSERSLLGIAPRRVALIREVMLICHGEPWVFARSVIPASSCNGELRHLRGLQNRSLGTILFSNPHLVRSPFQVARIQGSSDYLPAELRHNGTSWGRRSRFLLREKGIMVSEVFLPTFKPWTGSRLHRFAHRE